MNRWYVAILFLYVREYFVHLDPTQMGAKYILSWNKFFVHSRREESLLLLWTLTVGTLFCRWTHKICMCCQSDCLSFCHNYKWIKIMRIFLIFLTKVGDNIVRKLTKLTFGKNTVSKKRGTPFLSCCFFEFVSDKVIYESYAENV